MPEYAGTTPTLGFLQVSASFGYNTVYIGNVDGKDLPTGMWWQLASAAGSSTAAGQYILDSTEFYPFAGTCSLGLVGSPWATAFITTASIGTLNVSGTSTLGGNVTLPSGGYALGSTYAVNASDWTNLNNLNNLPATNFPYKSSNNIYGPATSNQFGEISATGMQFNQNTNHPGYVLTVDANGNVIPQAASGGSLTPWTSDINAAQHGLTNLGNLEITNTNASPTIVAYVTNAGAATNLVAIVYNGTTNEFALDAGGNISNTGSITTTYNGNAGSGQTAIGVQYGGGLSGIAVISGPTLELLTQGSPGVVQDRFGEVFISNFSFDGNGTTFLRSTSVGSGVGEFDNGTRGQYIPFKASGYGSYATNYGAIVATGWTNSTGTDEIINGTATAATIIQKDNGGVAWQTNTSLTGTFYYLIEPGGSISASSGLVGNYHGH